MKSTDELFGLIRSLSKTEKRYFRLVAKQNERNGKSNYVLLFDAIDAQEEYDEERLFEELKGEKLLDNFASTKYLLTKVILKSLRSFHDGTSVDMQIRSLMDEVEILFHKGQLKLCQRLVKKAEKLVQDYERHAMRLIVTDWKWRLLRRGQTRIILEPTEEKIRETKELLSNLQDHVEYKSLEERIMLLQRVKPRARTPEELDIYDQLMSNERLQGGIEPKSISARMAYYEVLGLNQTVRGNYQGGFEFYQKCIGLWRDNPHLIADDELAYLTTLFNYITHSLFSENSEVFRAEINYLKAFKPKHPYNKIKVQSFALHQELSYMMNYAEWDAGLTAIKELDIWLKENDGAISDSSYITFVYNITIFFFLGGEFSMALRWLNKILFSPRTGSRQDIQDFARIFQLIIHYELGNHDLLEYLFRSTYRYLRNQEKMLEFERVIIEFIRRSSRSVSRPELLMEFQSLKTSLESLAKQPSGRKPLALQELIFYLESRIRGMDIRVLYEEKVREREEERQLKKEKAG